MAELRRVDVDSPDLAAFLRVTGLVFKSNPHYSDEQVEQVAPSMRGHRLTAAYDRDSIVGTFRSWELGLTVPGTTFTAEAISSVAVLPTHRRRGLLSALMHDDLTRAAGRGTAVAILLSADGPIYGRFGFGVCTEAVTRVLDVRSARLRSDVDTGGSVEMITEAQLREVGPEIYAAARGPGAIDRTGRWWDFHCGVTPQVGVTRAARVAALHRDPDGRPDGYLNYRQQDDWDDRITRTVVHLESLEAATPQAWAGLWGLLAGLDNVAEVRAMDRPPDEPISHLLTDVRAARTTARNDFLWSRVLDPAAVLSGRHYQGSGGGVIEVIDPDGWAAGRVLLEVHEDGSADCGPTQLPADVTMPVDTLGAVWLGGTSLLGLARTGRARENCPGGLARLDRLLHTGDQPWCSTWF